MVVPVSSTGGRVEADNEIEDPAPFSKVSPVDVVEWC